MDVRREPVARVDAAWLRMDEPGNSMVVTGVLVLREPIPFDRFRELVASRLAVLPRLRQRIIKSRTISHSLAWATDPHFDLSYHVQVTPLDRPDRPSLQNLVGRMMSAPLDLRRPLWQFHFVPQYEDGCAVICRSHHCLGDGAALLYLLLRLTDNPPAAATQEGPPASKHAMASGRLPAGFRSALISLASSMRSVEKSVMRAAKEVIARPVSALDAARALTIGAAAVWKILFMSSDPHTALKGQLSGEKRAVWARPIPIETLKNIARVTDSTVNDVVLSAFAGGLRRYLVSRNQRVDGLELRALVPVNLRPIEEAPELGNRFGLMFVPLPLGSGAPVDRLDTVRNNTLQIKRSPERLVTFLILQLLGRAPSTLFAMVVSLFVSRCTAVVTNVVGPREPLKVAGTTLKQVLFWVPCAGRLGLGVSILSYSGALLLSVAADSRLVPDPEAIIDGFESEIASLVEFSLQARVPSRVPLEADARARG